MTHAMDSGGTAYGTYSAVLGVLDFPASVLAGALLQGVGSWSGFGPSAPFLCGGRLACLAALLMAWWMPQVDHQRNVDGTPTTLSLLAVPR